MGLREYARYRGVSLTTVQRKIKRGLISTLKIEGKVKIDVKSADRLWELNKILSGQLSR
jgi:hypothetical protein